jgi:hypothetical protein
MAPTIMVPGQEILTSMGLTTGQYVDHYVGTLINVASNIGQTAKKEETWASTTLFEYSKRYYLLGVEVSCALKKAIRLGTEPNEGVLSFSGGLTNICSGVVSISGADFDPMASYILTIYEVSPYFDVWFPKVKLSPTELTALCLTPRVLCG